MNRLLFFLLFSLTASLVQAQSGYLFVKKGIKKKKTYLEGDMISLQLIDGGIFNGYISRLENDTIYLSGLAIPRVNVKTVLLAKKKKNFHVPVNTVLIITAGVALVTAGLTLSEQAEFGEALTAGLVIGYGPLLVQYIGSKISFKRKKYKIGKKYRLQILDFHIPLKGF